MYRLTKPQKLIYDMHKFAGGGIAIICGSVLIHGKKDVPCLIAAVNEIYRLNDALRIRIMETGKDAKQKICDFKEQDVETLRFETREQFGAYANTYAVEPLDLYGSLCDIKIVILDDSYGILVKLHHIVGDAWTLSLLGSQFCTLVNGETPEAHSYTQYIEQEEAYLQSPRYQRDRAFFLEQFKECDEVTYLSDKQSDSVESRRRTFVMDKEEAARINAYAEKNNTSAFVLFMSAFAVYMNRTKMNAERFYIGTAVLNRAGARDKNTMGMFINSAPILMRLDNEASFAENLAAIQQSSFSVFRHQKYNYGDVLTDIRKEYSFGEKLYDVMLSYQNAAITGTDRAFESTWYHSGAQTESLQIHIDDRDGEGIFRIHFDYQTEKFTEPEVEKLYGHFTNLLFDAIENDSKKLYELKILSEAEKNKLLYEFNDTAADYPRDKCVHQLFEEQARKTPDKTAVIACDQTLTYAQLNEQANRIAHGLIEQGVKVGDIVAFALLRKSYLISVMFGILKAGAAYMPVDPDFPEERIRYMLEDCGAKLFISERDIGALLSNKLTGNPLVEISGNNLCYCIYTSGSTGLPKGAMLTHQNIVNYISHNHDNVMSKIVSEDIQTILSVSSVTFDIFTTESLLPLAHGLTVLLASEEQSKVQSALNNLIKKHPADLIQTPPSKLKALLTDEEHQEFLHNLKAIILGGETFDIHFVNRLRSITNAQIYNCYGPTEASVAATISKTNKKTNYQRKLSHSSILSVYKLNEKSSSVLRCSKSRLVHKCFEVQAQNTSEKVAVIACDQTLTYAQLDDQANRIAHSLIERDVKVGDIVAFALPRKSYLISAIFGILKAGAAYMPIDPDFPEERIRYMLEDSGARVFITEANIEELLSYEKTESPQVLMTGDSLCYCVYTSGSTGLPKGTILHHKGVINVCSNNISNEWLQELTKHCNMMLCVGSIIFDIFSFEIMPALLNGMSVVLASEEEVRNPISLGRLLTEHSIDAVCCTPTKLDAYLAAPEFSDAMKQVKIVVVAGEKLLGSQYNRIRQFTDAVIFNGYGPAETTMGVSFGKVCSDDQITIGRPIANTQIYIVDKYLQNTPVGIMGEMCISGDGVGLGYLNRPELTAEKFIDNPFGKGKLYKTGDLAYWRDDGNIIYVGRNDFQVKIRGLRIELGEIENAIASVEGITQAVVDVRKDSEGRQLICAFYIGKEQEGREIRSTLNKTLPQYMLPHSFTHMESLPLTASGKVNRRALPDVDLSSIVLGAEYVAPITPKEKLLVSAIQNVLGADRVGTMDNFFDLGGDSLKAIELIAALERKGYHTNTKTIFSCGTIKALAESLDELREKEAALFPAAGDVPATPAQMRVYTAQSMNDGSTMYNVPCVFKVDSLDPIKLQEALISLIERHEMLRTYFENRGGVIVQVVDEQAHFALEQLENGDISAFIRPFDLHKAPLLRAGYFENTVMIDMHHIIADGGTTPVFLRELNAFYLGDSLDDTPVSYRQFAMEKVDYSESEEYWLSIYADEVPVLEMNTDYKRGQKRSYNGSAIYDFIKPQLRQDILAKCRELSITPYVFYMSAFYTLLSKFSGNEDIVVGMPISGRKGKYLNTIGMFVNTIALREKPEGMKSVRRFLSEVRDASVDAIAHQDYPYGELVKKLNANTPDRNPLFDVMFAYQSETMTSIVFGDKEAEMLPIPSTTSKYDFTLNVMPRESDVVLMAEYCTDLYKEKTIQRLLAGYKLVLEQMLDSDRLLKDICAITADEEYTLREVFNNTAVDYPKDKCVHTLFEEQVKRTPDKTAVIACDATLTYAQLNEQANRIAHGLIAKGVRPGDIVAFILPRRSYLIAAMLGILKAGAAYMPIDPDYPKERIDYMLEDSQAKLCITEENINEIWHNEAFANPDIPCTGKDLCYCIYTSGSTGKPKGTLLAHRNVSNYIQNNNYNVVHKIIKSLFKSILSVTTVGFDIFVTESLLPLVTGLQIIFASESQATIQAELNTLMERYPADVMQTTPTKMRSLIQDASACGYLKTLKAIILGGEALDGGLVNELQQLTAAQIFNIYGPTETTVWSTSAELYSPNDITIGKPVANTQIHIVDRYMHLMPIGTIGELCIAGDGVGAGYLNRPELTAEKFVDNPFGEGKLYKTGDLAYWREDGNIVYVGRNDFQVKIRGLRIELGEIESAICSVPGVSQAVVVVRKDEAERQMICAFYTESAPVSAEQIKNALRERLPRYMMPHIFTLLPVMPLTSSGKINRKALPEVDLGAGGYDSEYVKPEGALEKHLAQTMAGVLGYSPIGRNDDFFDLGGDSLKAIEFVSKAYSEGIYFALQNIFDHPTVKLLAEHIENGNKHEVTFDDIDFTEADRLLARNNIDNIITPSEEPVGNILLAGATGYLGVHILADYLEHDSGMAYCLVRGEDEADSKRRFAELLQFYFGDKYNNSDRITVIRADLQKEHFGLEQEEYSSLLTKTDMVINAAASVKHYGSYKYFHETNVESVTRLIDFCKKADARLIHTSTLSVSGNSFADHFDGYVSETEKHFYESSLYIGQALDNVYARSKFEAERAVLEAMGEGLHANIMRMGNLTNRLSDGVFQKNHESNAFLKRVMAILEMGVFPEYLLPIYAEFTPINEAANAVMTIARHFSDEYTVFHINSTKVYYMDKLLEYCKKLGYDIKVVDGMTFSDALRKTMEQSEMEHIFETFINDMDEQGQLNYDSNIRIENDFTEEYLRRLGFEWPELGIDYLRKYLTYFKKIGYLEGKQNV